ncbi:GntP family permease [Youngiibacter multivorans]|uniref:H+/gluconate symporter-like permease n=1 Tax=Youngiibacter multivorans TaxID=937251 RepID=A0ABS4FZH8_9CLOT|nr:GntP family permease [Youngiibacter multivorans]MBP1917671.1 H+/gluconate symporter-like permease [Youngiibacter multivorans]
MLGIIGLLMAILVLVVLAYKGVGAFPITIVAGFIVILTNGMDIWESFSDVYMNGYLGFFKNYFFIFAASSLYAKLMEESGAAIAIGYKFVDWFGSKRAVLIVFMITVVLTYGGINLFIAIFAVTPIIMVLFKEADIPRRLAIGVFVAGSGTVSLSALPGSPSLANVIPTRYLGTSITAAPVLGIIAAVMMALMILVYLNWEENRLRKAGEHFSYIPGTDHRMYEVDKNSLPPAGISFIPLAIVIGMIIGLKEIIPNAAALIVLAMITASVAVLAFFWSRIKDKKATINTGLGGAIGAIAGPCAVVAFGAIVQESSSFIDVVGWINSLRMNPYWTSIIATGIMSGVTGSSSGGLTITLQTFAEQFKASGANLSILHRLILIASGSFALLPHCSAFFLMFGWLGLTHKEGYRFVGVVGVIIPFITLVVLTTSVIAMGL